MSDYPDDSCLPEDCCRCSGCGLLSTCTVVVGKLDLCPRCFEAAAVDVDAATEWAYGGKRC